MRLKSLAIPAIVIVSSLLLWSACGGSDGGADSGGEQADAGSTEPGVDGGSGGESKDGSGKDKTPALPLDRPLASDETRAGQITSASELISGKQAAGVVGDWKLYNSKVAFVIHGVGVSRSWGGRGGQLLDAAPVGPSGKGEGDLLEEIFPAVGFVRVVKALKVELVSAGGKGKPAIIRVTGKDQGVPATDAILPAAPLEGLTPIIEYVLEPGADSLRIITRIEGERDSAVSIGDGLLLGDRTRQALEKQGFDTSDAPNGAISWLAAVGRGVSYLFVPQRPVTIPLMKVNIIPALGPSIPESVEAKYERRLFVGSGDLERLFDSMRKLKPPREKMVKLTGKVFSPDGSPLVGAPVRLLDEDARGIALSETLTGKDGSFSFMGPKGRKLSFKALPPGSLPLKAKAEEGREAELQAPSPAKVTINVYEVDRSGSRKGRIPARVELFGPKRVLNNHAAVSQELLVPPGKYRAVVSRGFEYDFWQKNIEVKEAGSATIDAELKRVVDTPGQISADLHLHAAPSPDSSLSLQDRLRGLVAEGVELGGSSDHDTFTDYAPLIAKMGLGPFLTSLVGNEVSPMYGHYNAFGVKVPAKDPTYYGAMWAVYDKKGKYSHMLQPPKLCAMLRKKYGAKLIQINHPRSAGSGVFSHVGFDPKTGLKGVGKKKLDANWELLEIYNGGGRSTLLKKTLKDWFSLLNEGHRKVATGNSDSHRDTSRPGLPRNLIAVGTDDPQKVKPADVVEALAKGRTQILAGPVIEFTLDGKGLGAVVVGKSVEAKIKIKAAPWVSVSWVKLYANGKVLKEFKVTEKKKVLRFETSLAVSPSQDTWYVVMAGDEKKSMGPVYRGRLPLSLTNPIRLDRDGDGFDPPGL